MIPEFSGFSNITPIGIGAYSSVFAATEFSTGCLVAVKQISLGFQDLLDTKRALREITILPQLNHPNIVKFGRLLPADEDNTTLSYTMEYCRTDLAKDLKRNIPFSLTDIKVVIYQILCALAYWHNVGVIHRDIKPANVLIHPETLTVKLWDFGLARDIQNPGEDYPVLSKYTHHVVSRHYRAPEVILLESYSTSSDIWSVGCVLGELLGQLQGSKYTGPLFPGRSCFPLSPVKSRSVPVIEKEDQLQMIFNILGTPSSQDIDFISNANTAGYCTNFPNRPAVSFTDLWPSASPVALDLLSQFLQFSPSRRPTAVQALAHNWFDDVRRRELECCSGQLVMLPFESNARLSKEELDTLFNEEYAKYQGN